jgi:hypothetical protein
MGPAAELARHSVERWNAQDLDAVYATWDSEIVVRPDPYFPDSGELVGQAAAQRFWEDQREYMGTGVVEILEEHDRPAVPWSEGSTYSRSVMDV